MKTVLLFLTSLIFSYTLLASNKILIETAKSITNISLINSKAGETKKLLPWGANKTSFLFEVEDLNDLFLKFPTNLQIRLYSFNEKVSTDWQNVKKEEAISVKSFFLNAISKNIELEDFIIKSFLSNPLINFNQNLRKQDNFYFHTPDNVNFGVPENLFISWESKITITELQLIDLSNYSVIYSSQNLSDTVLIYKDLPDDVKLILANKSKFCVLLKTQNAELGNVETKLVFELDPFRFLDQAPNLFFLSPKKLDIRWSSKGEPVALKIFDGNNTLIFSQQNSQQKCTFEDIKTLHFKIQKPYKFELKYKNQTIHKLVYILCSDQDISKLN